MEAGVKNPSYAIFEYLHKKLKHGYTVRISPFRSHVLQQEIMMIGVEETTTGNVCFQDVIHEGQWGRLAECAMSICRYTKQPERARQMVRKFFIFKTTFLLDDEGDSI